MPARYRTAARSSDFRGFFSTTGPKNAAPMPRKKIDAEKIHEHADGDAPHIAWNAPEK